MFECERFTLPNGLRIVITPNKNATIISNWILVKGGTRAEKKEKMGLFHFNEHMFFTGGVKYPNSLALNEAVDRVGAYNNAMTGKEEIMYVVEHGMSSPILGLDILEDMMVNARFPEDEITRQKGAVLGEMRKYNDDTDDLLFRGVCKNLLYGEHPLGFEILGTEETLKNLQRADLINCMQTFYRANNMVISIAGNVDVVDTVREIENRFGKISSASVPEWEEFDPVNAPRLRVFTLSRKEKTDADILVVTQICGYNHGDKNVIDALGSILGGGMSSRLFQELREKRGLVYAIGSGGMENYEIGEFYSKWGADHDDIKKSIRVVLQEYKKIREEYISDVELEKAKGYLIGRKEMRFSNTMAIAKDYAHDEMFSGGPELLEIYKQEIMGITKDDVLRVAQTYFRHDKLKIAMTAREKYCDKEKLQKILEKAR